MLDKKTDVLEALKSIAGIDGGVFIDRPKINSKLSCISFYEISNSPDTFADDEEYLSRINFVIDIWAKTHEETGKIAKEVNRVMGLIGFTREFSRDVIETDIKHKTMRYEYIGG